MANLESLELTISANAASAMRGVKTLAESLSKLKLSIDSSMGTTLASIGDGLKHIAESANANIRVGNLLRAISNMKVDGSAAGDLERVATALERIKEAAGGDYSGIKALADLTKRSTRISDAVNAGRFEGERQPINIRTLAEGSGLSAEQQAELNRRAEEYKAQFDGILEKQREAAKAADAVRAAQEKAYYNGPTPKSLAETDDIASYITELDRLEASVESASQKFNELYNSLGAGDAKTVKAALALNKAREAVDQYREAQERAAAETAKNSGLMGMLNQKPDYSHLGDFVNQNLGIGSEVKSAADSMSAFMQGMQGDTGIAQSVREANPELQQFCEQAMNAGTGANELTTKLVGLDGELKKKKGDANKAKEGIEDLRKEMDKTGGSSGSFRKGLKEMTGGVSNLWSRIKRIATTMLIRSALKGLVKSAKEGITNMYHWSKLNKGEFASSLDSVTGKLATVKNSVGAALSGPINAVIPIINNLSSAFITACNWVNQLYALLSGKSTWTKATDQVKEYDDATKSASGSTKDMLADFDELNVIQSTSSGGSSSGNNTDYSNMFTEMTTFQTSVKKFVQWLDENLPAVITLITAAATAFGTWKISDALTGDIKKINNLLGAAAVIAFTITATWLLDNEYLKSGDDGFLVANILTTAVGSTIAAKLVKNVLGGKAGAYTAALTLTLSALTDIIALVNDKDVKALDEESLKLSMTAALKAGAATGVVLKTAGAVSGTVGTLAASAGGALIAFGLAIATKATVDAVEAGEITKDTLEADAIASVTAGIGTGVLVAATGVSAGLAIAAGGGAALLVFGLAVGVAAVLTADKAQIQWGNVQLTKQDVEEFVGKQMFTVDVDVTIEEIHTHIGNIENAKKQVQSDLQELIPEVNAFVLGIDSENSLANIKTILGDETRGLIKDISDLCNAEISQLKFTFTNFSMVDGEGNDISAEALEAGTAGWGKVKAKISALGTKLAELTEAGYTKGIANFDEEAATALLNEIVQLTSAVANAKTFGAAFTTFTGKIGDLTKTSAADVKQAFVDMKAELEAGIRESMETTVESYWALYEYYLTLGDKDQAEIYKQLAEDLQAGLEESVQTATDNAAEPGKKIILEGIKEMFSDANGGNGYKLDLESLFDIEFGTSNPDFDKEVSDRINKAIEEACKEVGYDMEALDVIGLTGWDVMTDDMKQQIYDNLYNLLNGDVPGIVTQLRNTVGDIPAEDLLIMTDWDNLTDDVKQQVIAALKGTKMTAQNIQDLKDYLELSAKDIFSISGWENMSSSELQQFITNLKNTFGDAEVDIAVKAMLNDAGLDDSAKTKLQNACKDAASKANAKVGIDKEGTQTNVTNAFKGIKPTVTTLAKVASNATKTINSFFKKNVKPTVNVDATPSKNAVSNVENGIEKKAKPTVTVDAEMKNNALTNIRNLLNALTGTANVNVQLSNTKTLGDSLASVFSGITWTLNGVKQKITAWFTQKAEGGFVANGELFLAREAGPEMVGTIGGRTAVANNDQIVDGISKGVRDANERQNSLLREQNQLLRAILQKDNSVRLGASSALGREVRKSLNMYDSMVGGV